MSQSAAARRALVQAGLTRAGLTPAELDATAAHLPEPLATTLRQMSAALRSPDAAAALDAALAGVAADEAALRGQLHGLEAPLGAAGRDLAAGLAQLQALAASMGAAGAGLAATLEQALAAEGPDAAALREAGLTPALAQALRESAGSARALGDPAVLAALQGAGALGDAVGAALRGGSGAEERLEQQVLGLELAAQALEDAAQRVQAPLEALDQAAAALAADHPAEASTLAQASAALREQAGQPDPAAWEQALQAALRAEDLDAARRAGQQAQLAALAAGDHARAAVVAHRVADLAARQGDARAEVTARLEEALCLARLPEHRGSTRMILDGAQRAAGADRGLGARARLVRGQILEQWGEHAAAWDTLRPLQAEALPDPDLADIAGRAALSLGRVALATGRPTAAREQLGLALTLGRAGGDWRLYSPALSALLELALSTQDRAGARALLRDALAQAPRLGGPEARAALDRMVQALIAQYGPELLQGPSA